MADTAALIISDGPQPDSDSALFHRRIEFHHARKNFSGFVNESSNGFKLVTLNPTSDPVKPSGVGKKTDKSSELSEAGLDPELSFEITFRRIGAGLRNLGNTCFLNSVLQCLTYTAPLAAYLQSGKHQNSCRTAGFCALCAIQKHVSRALQSTGRILEPKDLVSNLRCISRTFRNARQEDAHEYMVNLLESMHKCCLPSGVPSESPSAYEKSLVHKIFGGRLRSQVKCMQCSYCSNKFDPFLDLSLEITKAESLNKALGHFTAKEQLDGGAREYKCEQCKQKVKAFKQLTIHKAPEVLAVHLKRFSSLAPGQKIDRKVAFGSTLDLKPFVTGPYDGDLNYTLYGVLVHYGWSTHSGHYYCFVRTSSGMWYSLDDNQVVQVNERKVLEQKAYMLFYVRDRKNVNAKNHVNARQKENMVMNAIGNAAYLNGSFPTALSGRDAIGTPLPAKNLSSNLNGKLTAEHLGLVRNTNSDSLMVPPTKAPLRDHSVMEMKSVDQKGDSCSRVTGTDCTSNLGHIAGIITDKKLSVREEQNTAVPMMSDIERPQNSLHMKESSNISFAMPSGCKDNGKEKPNEPAEKQLSSSVLSTSCRDPLKMDGTISEMNTSKIIPVGASSVKTAGSNADDAVENGQSIAEQSKLLSELPATTEPATLGMPKKKGQDLKARRKLFKFRVTTSLSSNIIFGVGLRSRKKRLRKKRHRSMEKSTNPENNSLTVNFIPSKPGQAENCTFSQKKKVKYDLDGQKQNFSMENVSGNCSISGDVDSDFRERVLLNGSAVSAGKQLQARQSTAAQGTGGSEECQRELRQTDVMSILTRGLEETTVGRWDDIGVTLPEKSETRASSTSAAQIGYIGDEWDEEYDRGKRKKVRQSKMSFGGPNLFQELANHKSKAKRVKLNRSGDGNQPFRIL